MMRNIFLVISAILLATCSGSNSSFSHPFGNSPSNRAKAFAEAYFNYDYAQALKMVTPESKQWIHFAASNVTQDELDTFNSLEDNTTAEVIDENVVNDSLTMIEVVVKNVVEKDTIERACYVRQETSYWILVVKRAKEDYRIKMEGLPQSEKSSRD
jgi:hypothetical protein